MLYSKRRTELESLSLIAEPSEDGKSHLRIFGQIHRHPQSWKCSPYKCPPSQVPLTKKGRLRSMWFNKETLLFTARARSWAFSEFIQGPRGCEDKSKTQSYRLAASLCCLGGQASLRRSTESFWGRHRGNSPTAPLLFLEHKETRTEKPEGGRRSVRRKMKDGES